METSKSKVFIEEAENLITAIRAGVLVHLHDGIRPEDLRIPLDSARVLNASAETFGDEELALAADTLEAWLTLLTAETDPISHTRTRSLLDQISELEVALIAHKAAVQSPTLDVAGFVDESFRSISPAANDNQAEDFELDAEMLEVFREEAESLLQEIRANLRALSERPHDRDALWKIKKAAHTFKGSAGIVGLGESSDLAHRIEDLLERLAQNETDSDNRTLDLLINAADCLSSLAGQESSPEVTARVASLYREFDDTLRELSDGSNGTVRSVRQLTEVKPVPTANRPEPTSKFVRTGIVRVSLDRLDDLVRNVRDLVLSRYAFEKHMRELAQQIEESSNNTLRLQAASGKIGDLELTAPFERKTDGGRRSLIEQSAYELTETASDAATINSSLDTIKEHLGKLSDKQRDLIEEIRERLMRLRNVEFGSISTRLQRTVSVTCDDEGKNAGVLIENGSVELDTQTIDLLIEPLMHLLKNAVVHGIEAPETRRMLGKPEKGRITIRVASDAENVYVTVTDDGRGIAFQPLVDKAVALGLITRMDADNMRTAQLCELIFLPGLTTAERLTVNAGRGVGMSIVRESINAAHGTISIETWPQRGTTFRVRVPLPFSEMHVPGSVESLSPRNAGPNDLSVFIVDDSPSVRLMTSRTIQKAGWDVQTAKNGIDALEKLTTMSVLPGLILTDIEMPRMDGYEFLAGLRVDRSLREIPVIVISSKYGGENREDALAAGAVEYITKPYDEQHLIELIDRVARRGELVGAD